MKEVKHTAGSYNRETGPSLRVWKDFFEECVGILARLRGNYYTYLSIQGRNRDRSRDRERGGVGRESMFEKY